MEYPEGCSTTMRHVARKVGLYGSEVVSPWGCYSRQVDLHMTSRGSDKIEIIFIG